MVDLGKYALEVGMAYGVSLALIAGVVWLSVSQARAAKRDLDEAEARARK